MSTDLTPQQHQAVAHRHSSVVLASGAGCGKTHVLTARYLSHLAADGAEVAQVVAITFTDRAAREMRDRIRKAIEKQPDATKHLRDLETAPIATIHSFCGNLLRQFAVPAGLDPGFEVLDDVLSANVRTEALTGGLQALLTDTRVLTDLGSPNAALRELVVLFGWNAVVEAIDGLLLSVDRPAWDAWLARSPEEMAAEWAGPVRAGLLPEWVAYLCAASPKVAGCLNLLGRVTSPNPQVMVNVRRILDETPNLANGPALAGRALADAVAELAELAKVGRSGKKDWPDEATYEAVRDAFTDFRADLPKRFGLFTDTPEKLAEAARVGQWFLRAASAVDDEYRRRKRRAGVLDFQDLLVLARDLIRDRPEVRKTLESRFQFLLLDELQDTDPVQMELIGLLCGAGLEHGKLFAVGDHKQSIYRFRGAEVRLFQNLRKSVAGEGRLGLTRNFRSQPGVLRFVNALFAKRMEDYEPLEPHLPAAGDAANVEFLWAEAGQPLPPPLPETERGEKQAPPSLVGKGAGGLGQSVAALRAAEADAIARRIVQLLEDPTPRVLTRDGSARRVERKDVVLLFRSMSHVATYEASLRRHGLDYYLVGGRAFFAQQEVYDLLNLLRAVENPQDSASLVGTLRSPFCGLSDEAVFLLAAHPDGPWAGVHDPDRVASLPADQVAAAERARRFLTRWREVKDRLPIAKLLNTVFADSGYDAAMQFEFLGDRKLANLWKLVELARTFDRTGLFGLHEFTARLGDLVVRQPREEQAATLPENADVVKLMSIHQAKGLEFPVVFVPDVAATTRGNVHPVARWHRRLGCLVRLPAEFDEFPDEAPFPDLADRLGKTADQLADWQEDLRILYVACTRARDLLILSAGLPGDVGSMPANHWTLALGERFDLRTGRCIADDVRPEEMPRVAVNLIAAGTEQEHPSVPVQANPERERGGGPREGTPSLALGVRLNQVSLPALERLARGEPLASWGEQFDTEGDRDRPEWRHPRERLGPVAPAEAVLWGVLDRWDFADVDGWAQLLADVAGDDQRVAADLRPKLRRFADSEARAALAGADDLRRGVEFLAELGAALFEPLPNPSPTGGGASPPSLAGKGAGGLGAHRVTVRGLIDFLYRDRGGWHVLAIDLGTTDEDDPWRGRRPGLILQAWAIRQQLGEWPRTIGLFDLATGQLVAADPRKVKLLTVADHFRRLIAQQRS